MLIAGDPFDNLLAWLFDCTSLFLLLSASWTGSFVLIFHSLYNIDVHACYLLSLSTCLYNFLKLSSFFWAHFSSSHVLFIIGIFSPVSSCSLLRRLYGFTFWPFSSLLQFLPCYANSIFASFLSRRSIFFIGRVFTTPTIISLLIFPVVNFTFLRDTFRALPPIPLIVANPSGLPRGNFLSSIKDWVEPVSLNIVTGILFPSPSLIFPFLVKGRYISLASVVETIPCGLDSPALFVCILLLCDPPGHIWNMWSGSPSLGVSPEYSPCYLSLW